MTGRITGISRSGCANNDCIKGHFQLIIKMYCL